MPSNNQEEDNYVIQQLPKHSALHTMGGWGGALSAHLGDYTLRQPEQCNLVAHTMVA